jgi:hypothetical protein
MRQSYSCGRLTLLFKFHFTLMWYLLKIQWSDDVIKYSTLFTHLLHCLLIYYTCDVNICVEMDLGTHMVCARFYPWNRVWHRARHARWSASMLGLWWTAPWNHPSLRMTPPGRRERVIDHTRRRLAPSTPATLTPTHGRAESGVVKKKRKKKENDQEQVK